jgi:hypothetical protein
MERVMPFGSHIFIGAPVRVPVDGVYRPATVKQDLQHEVVVIIRLDDGTTKHLTVPRSHVAQPRAE